MRIYALFSVTVLITSVAFADDVVDRYEIDLEIFPKTGMIKAEAVITLSVKEGELSELLFTFNKNMEIKSFTSDVEFSFEFQTEEQAPNAYTDHCAPLRIKFDKPLKMGEEAELRLSYQGVIKEHRWGVNLIKPSWVEIHMQSGWFPFETGETNFSYDVSLKIDPEYLVTGSGQIGGGNGEWRLRSDDRVFDIVVIAGPYLRSRLVEFGGGVKVCLNAARLDDEEMEHLAGEVKKIYADCIDWFGKPGFGEFAGKELTFVFTTERQRGGGYARPGLVVMTYSTDQQKYIPFFRMTAHEIAHFWWNGALAESWQNWLNEGFAEYTSLMAVRKYYGEDKYMEWINNYRVRSEGKPPIWGIDPDDDASYVCLYWKASVILHDLRESLGDEKFMRFLRVLSERNAKTTDELLIILDDVVSEEARIEFEQALKR